MRASRQKNIGQNGCVRIGTDKYGDRVTGARASMYVIPIPQTPGCRFQPRLFRTHPYPSVPIRRGRSFAGTSRPCRAECIQPGGGNTKWRSAGGRYAFVCAEHGRFRGRFTPPPNPSRVFLMSAGLTGSASPIPAPLLRPGAIAPLFVGRRGRLPPSPLPRVQGKTALAGSYLLNLLACAQLPADAVGFSRGSMLALQSLAHQMLGAPLPVLLTGKIAPMRAARSRATRSQRPCAGVETVGVPQSVVPPDRLQTFTRNNCLSRHSAQHGGGSAIGAKEEALPPAIFLRLREKIGLFFVTPCKKKKKTLYYLLKS